MGNYYVNFSLRGAPLREVADVLSGRSAVVAPDGDYSVVYDEVAEGQDLHEISRLGKRLSNRLSCTTFAVLNHDDDVLWYRLFQNGEIVDEYCSRPNHFLFTESVLATHARWTDANAPVGGDPTKLAAAFGVDLMPQIENALRSKQYEYALRRHIDLAKALGLPQISVGIGYADLASGETLPGVDESELIRVL